MAAGRTASAIEFDAADAAAGRARDMPPPLAQTSAALSGDEPHPQLDAVVELDDVEREISSGDCTMPSLRLKPTAKSSQILRRAHHHGVGAAVIGQRQRGLFRDQPRALAETAIAPGLAIDGADRIVHRLLRGLQPGAMRREWRACSS